jgi:hypothetical protein
MDAIDKLLAELQTQQQAQPSTLQSELVQPEQSYPLASLDDLLDAIADDTKHTVQQRLSHRALTPNSGESSLPPINYDILDTLAISDPKSISPSQYPVPPAQLHSPDAQLLSQLSHQYQEHDRLAALHRQQERQEAEHCQQQEQQARQQRMEALKAKRRAELAQQACEWLKRLNPKTPEGQWFEEFACGYGLPLEAAIDYLEALQEVNQDEHDLDPRQQA